MTVVFASACLVAPAQYLFPLCVAVVVGVAFRLLQYALVLLCLIAGVPRNRRSR